jgi:UDP-N-acetyl-D-galactosamine dehydrogenase
MSKYVAERMVKCLVNADIPVKNARIGVLGLSFKEDVNDIRNSKVPNIITELKEFGINAIIHDPHATKAEALHEYGLNLSSLEEFRALDGVVFAVSHKWYMDMGIDKITASLRDGGVFVDVKSVYDASKMKRGIRYWSL